jgi:hypothetical protein
MARYRTPITETAAHCGSKEESFAPAIVNSAMQPHMQVEK